MKLTLEYKKARKEGLASPLGPSRGRSLARTLPARDGARHSVEPAAWKKPSE